MNICCKCGKVVGFAEKIQALDKCWHKTCFCCTRCLKVLRPGHYVDNKKEPYCKNCYNRKFGPKGVHGSIVMDTERQDVNQAKLAKEDANEDKLKERLSRCTSGEIDNSSRSFKDLRSMFNR